MTSAIALKGENIHNKPFYGNEPDINDKNHIRVFNWYNGMCSYEHSKQFIIDFLENCNEIDSVNKIRSLKENQIIPTVGWIARILIRGGKITKEMENFFVPNLKAMLKKATLLISKNENKKVIPLRTDALLKRAIEYVEGIIDDNNSEVTLLEWLNSNNIPKEYVSKIRNRVTPQLYELLEAYEGNDVELKEAYKNFTKQELEKRIKFSYQLFDDLNKYENSNSVEISTEKKQRKERKKKAVPVQKKLKTFKYAKKNEEYGVSSVPVEKLIGAKEVVLFNCKYRTITLLKSNNESGLDIKGTTFLNVDEKSSSTKGTGHNTKNIVSSLLSGTKVHMNKVFSSLKSGKKPLLTRSNENTIILRII